jgi:hypothetical protein
VTFVVQGELNDDRVVESWKQELYFRKKKSAAKAPWVVTLARPPISMELDRASAEVTSTPLMVAVTLPEKAASPPVWPVEAEN